MRSCVVLSLLVFISSVAPACKGKSKAQQDVPQASPNNREEAEVLEVGALHIVDISAVGARLGALDTTVKAALVAPGDDSPSLRINPENGATLTVEVLNTCSGPVCQLVANATVSRALESGLRERFQVVAHAPLDGIDYEEQIQPLTRDLRIGLHAQLRARNATAKQLAEWLMAPNVFYRDAAFRAVVERKVLAVAPQIAVLMKSDEERVALLAVAAAGVLGSDELLTPLEELSLSANANIADAAMQALADIGTVEAFARLENVARSASSDPMIERARGLLGKHGDKVSPSTPSSGKDEAR